MPVLPPGDRPVAPLAPRRRAGTMLRRRCAQHWARVRLLDPTWLP
ncbi:hypothetical protein [Pseudonocardia yuanmonensis]